MMLSQQQQQHPPQLSIKEKDIIPFKDLKRILDTPLEQRDPKEQQLLLAYTTQIPFFQKYIANGYRNIPVECAKVLRPISMKKGDIVFQINSEGSMFYIVMQGEVGLFTKIADETTSTLTLMKILSQGDSFGELGLLNFKLRSATVQCLSDCEFAVIEKRDFDKILKQLEQELLEEKMAVFASENQIMKFSSKHTIKSLYFNAIFKNFTPNELIFSMGEPLQAIYLIKSGQFQLLKEYNKGSDNLEEDEEERGDQLLEQKEQQQKQMLNRTGNKNPAIETLSNIKEKKRFIPILELGKSQMFGYEDFLQKNPTYSYSIRCKEMGEVVVIRSIHFRKWLLSDLLTVKYLQRQMQQQQRYMEQRLTEILSNMNGLEKYYFQMKKESSEAADKKLSDPAEFLKKIKQFQIGLQSETKKKRKKFLYELDDGGEPAIQPDEKQKKLKQKFYNDALSKEFQETLAKNFHERFGTDNLTSLAKHVPQEIVQVVNHKLHIKYYVGDRAPPKMNKSIVDLVMGQLKSPSAVTAENSKTNSSIQIRQANIQSRPVSSKQRSPSHFTQSSIPLNTYASLSRPISPQKAYMGSMSPMKVSMDNLDFIENDVSISQNIISDVNDLQAAGTTNQFENLLLAKKPRTSSIMKSSLPSRPKLSSNYIHSNQLTRDESSKTLHSSSQKSLVNFVDNKQRESINSRNKNKVYSQPDVSVIPINDDDNDEENESTEQFNFFPSTKSPKVHQRPISASNALTKKKVQLSNLLQSVEKTTVQASPLNGSLNLNNRKYFPRPNSSVGFLKIGEKRSNNSLQSPIKQQKQEPSIIINATPDKSSSIKNIFQTLKSPLAQRIKSNINQSAIQSKSSTTLGLGGIKQSSNNIDMQSSDQILENEIELKEQVPFRRSSQVISSEPVTRPQTRQKSIEQHNGTDQESRSPSKKEKQKTQPSMILLEMLQNFPHTPNNNASSLNKVNSSTNTTSIISGHFSQFIGNKKNSKTSESKPIYKFDLLNPNRPPASTQNSDQLNSQAWQIFSRRHNSFGAVNISRILQRKN